MELLFFIFFVLSININYIKTAFSFRCFHFNPWAIYDFKALSRPHNSNQDLFYNMTKNIIYYNFCGDTLYDCKNAKTQVVLVNKDKNCTQLAGSYKKTTISSLNNRLSLITAGGEKIWVNSSQYYFSQVIFNIDCNFNVSGLKINSVTNKSLIYTINAESTHACPIIDINPYLVTINIITAIIFILLGFVQCIYGLRIFRASIFILFSIFIFSLVLLFIYEILLPNNSERYLFWICFGSSVLMGIIFSYFISYFISENKRTISLLIGLIFGWSISQLFLFGISNKLYFYIGLGLIIILFGCISFTKYEGSLIFYTSTLGSYLFVRGISFFIGKFPDEKEVIKLILLKNYSRMNEYLFYIGYVYISSIIICCIIGSIVQSKSQPKVNPNSLPLSNNAQYSKRGYIQLPDNRATL